MYQLEVDFLWDDKKNGDIRVFAAIDGGSLSSIRPITDSFIKAPNGTYVGE
jgi:hypothetical protein